MRAAAAAPGSRYPSSYLGPGSDLVGRCSMIIAPRQQVTSMPVISSLCACVVPPFTSEQDFESKAERGTTNASSHHER